jgi:hypothetical protein
MTSIPEEAAPAELAMPSEAESPETLLLIETGDPGSEPSVPTEDELLAGVRVLLQDTDFYFSKKAGARSKKRKKDIRH